MLWAQPGRPTSRFAKIAFPFIDCRRIRLVPSTGGLVGAVVIAENGTRVDTGTGNIDGLNLVFGVMRIVNLAHGDFLMLGAFLAFWLFTLYDLNPLPAVPIAFALFLLAGLLVPRLLAAKDPEMLSFIATIAFGTSERSIPGGELGQALAAVASFLTGQEVENGPIEVLGQTFPGHPATKTRSLAG